MLEFLSHNCKEKASFFLIVFFNLLIVCQKLLIERYNFELRYPCFASNCSQLYKVPLPILSVLFFIPCSTTQTTHALKSK
ncbi:hypothetical protein X973_12055 [Piscirickettsia salmonis]|nr:hypothetical protein X973_12055 [Piscirickettsia salmonis]WGZ72326.1 hypothetical protein E3220_12490 [Piscirickettsia salmonis EM-90]